MPTSKTLLIIDDDDDLREALAEQLALHEEFVPRQAANATDGIRMGRDSRIDLILLDVDLPDMDGREACRRMGLDAGANDYVAKPFRFAVLLARIRAHLRSHEQSEDAVFRIGPYEFRPAAKTLSASEGRKIRLTEKETNILKYLYRAGAKAVSREELLTEVWGYNAGVTTHTLETHIYRLRQKIEPEPGQARILVTDQGGYRLQP